MDKNNDNHDSELRIERTDGKVPNVFIWKNNELFIKIWCYSDRNWSYRVFNDNRKEDKVNKIKVVE